MTPEWITLPQFTRASFPAVTTTPSAARSFVRVTLRVWGLQRLIENAELIASELVTNAVKATRNNAPSGDQLLNLAPVSVELHLDEDAFRISVQDSSSEQPALQILRDDAENGRGLLLVETLSARWDVFCVKSGKVTWAELKIATPEDA